MRAIYHVKLSDGTASRMSLQARRMPDGSVEVFNDKWYRAEGSLKPDILSEEDGFSTWDSFAGRTVYHNY